MLFGGFRGCCITPSGQHGSGKSFHHKISGQKLFPNIDLFAYSSVIQSALEVVVNFGQRQAVSWCFKY